MPPLVPELTMVTLGGGVTPLAKPVDKTFWVLCIIKDFVAPELPRVKTFFNIKDELHALSIMSFAVEILSKSADEAVIKVLFGVVVCNNGLTPVKLNETPDVTVLRFMIFFETIALCKMLPVGKDLEETLTYCVGVPIRVALDVRVPKPMIVLAVP
ncbi:jg21180 [Pararge aegeria aegeria]|uniref:Jg21180 protein n=1 Tax=Pararge aegeria aegeria TaxID=348720 RepID=A0A8S4SNT4_9NEOP|nr:jg21180 [Pararge aegeria aegeria]